MIKYQLLVKVSSLSHLSTMDVFPTYLQVLESLPFSCSVCVMALEEEKKGEEE